MSEEQAIPVENKLSAKKRRRRAVPYSEAAISGAVLFFDMMITFATGVLALIWHLGIENKVFNLHLSASILVSIGVAFSFYILKLDNFDAISRPVRFAWRQFVACGFVFLVFIAVTFFLKLSAEFSRLWLLSWYIAALLFICLHRVLWFFVLHKLAKMGRFKRRIVLVGGGEEASHFLNGLNYNVEPWNKVVGIFDDRMDRDGNAIRHQAENWGTVDDVLEFCRRWTVDDIVITLPWSADKRLREIIGKLMELPINIRLGSNLEGFFYARQSSSSIGSVEMLDIVFRPLAGWKYALKLAEDKVLSFMLILFSSPLMLLVAMLIRLDSCGPVIFRQPRHGFNNKEFHVYKFRTMKDGTAPVSGESQTQRDDPRNTRIGGFLRSTSIDELPQLFNVLEGSMSLVGPRPHPVPLGHEYAPLVDGYFARHKVRPGITGWAQVNGLRGAVWEQDVMRRRVEHDVYYIDNWSLGFDLKILIMTIFRGMVGENAY